LNYLVCNMMKVFTRPTSASDFFSLLSIIARFVSVAGFARNAFLSFEIQR
jgi:hypothetical protein